jgi:ABC-type antimicrobial peptide transport system permease subunit
VPARYDIRKAALPLITVVAMIVIAMPVCKMAECTMPMDPMQGPAAVPGMGAFNTCDIMEMGSNALSAVVPPSAQSLLFALGILVAAFGGWVLSLRSTRVPAREVIRSGVSPPDPLGVRLIV